MRPFFVCCPLRHSGGSPAPTSRAPAKYRVRPPRRLSGSSRMKGFSSGGAETRRTRSGTTSWQTTVKSCKELCQTCTVRSRCAGPSCFCGSRDGGFVVGGNAKKAAVQRFPKYTGHLSSRNEDPCKLASHSRKVVGSFVEGGFPSMAVPANRGSEAAMRRPGTRAARRTRGSGGRTRDERTPVPRGRLTGGDVSRGGWPPAVGHAGRGCRSLLSSAL